MYVCLECWQVFDHRIVPELGEGGYCPVKGCLGELIDLDENFIAVIKTLNEKGYETFGCCSGHIWDYGVPGRARSYIAFQPYITKEELEPLPKGWKLSENEEGLKFIDVTNNESDPIRLQLAIFEGLKEVATWANALKVKDSELLDSELEQSAT